METSENTAISEKIDGHEKKKGIYSGLTAVIFWGLVPLYYIPIDHVSPLEILGHRIIWAAILLTLIMIVQKKIRLLIPKTSQIPRLFASSILIAINWLVFTFAVINENITQTALGYFINPLVSVFLGVIFLKESLGKLQWLAVFFAALGILLQLIIFGKIPLIALSLAFSFGLYGLIRKTLSIDPVAGLTIEVLFALPFAITFVAWSASNAALLFGSDPTSDIFLCLGGFVTAFPLLLFTAAVSRLNLTTIGMMQYIAPSLSLLIAVFFFSEPFNMETGVTFGFIWLALAVFSTDAVIKQRQSQ
ncbi:MAG: protein RarD [Gammaproteobacteria bacterium]|nr:protein RarD [Gammaproteobacteria bacterium]